MHADWLLPEGLPPQAGALMSTRRGGASGAPWDSMNLGAAVGDDAAALVRNRQLFAQATGATPVYLRQLHGARVVQIGHADTLARRPPQEADASVTTEPGVACTVLVADCLPVLFAAPEARAVAAAHAGWRGLASGVIEAALHAVCEKAQCEPHDVRAWLGACIGARQFEVGVDVLQAFGADAAETDPLRFTPRPGTHAGDGPRKWLANLPQLARDRLQAAGVQAIAGGEWCTVEAPSRFFSYRRDGVTGRMAAAIWIRA